MLPLPLEINELNIQDKLKLLEKGYDKYRYKYESITSIKCVENFIKKNNIKNQETINILIKFISYQRMKNK